MSFFDEDDFFLFTGKEIDNLKKTYRLPTSPRSDARWIKAGEKVFVEKNEISAGFFYFGSRLSSRYSDNDPSLVNPALPLSKKNNIRLLQANADHLNHASFAANKKVNRVFPCDMDFAALLPSERLVYVQWLAGGRIDTNVPDWIPVLFFYGLERRMIDDANRGIVPHKEQVAIKTEIERILTLYNDGKHPETIKHFLHLYQFIELKIADRKLYTLILPQAFRICSDMPILIASAMGQCAADSIPLSSDLIYHWYQSDCYFKKPVPYHRCANEFEMLFKILYKNTYGNGIIAKPSKQKLYADDYWYEPQSEALGFTVSYNIPRGLSDVSRTSDLQQKIGAIADECSQMLKRYSRLLGREIENTSDANLEHRFAFLLMPMDLWIPGAAWMPAAALDSCCLIAHEDERTAILQILKLLKKDSDAQKLKIIQYFTDTVFADYKTTYEAINFLEKLYKCYGFDKNDLYRTTSSGGTQDTLALDKNKIKSLRKDTMQVAALLADIFTDSEEDPPLASVLNPFNLDRRHAEFLMALIKKDLWKKEELESLAKVHKLMADGAIETINEAAFNEFDEALIEEDVRTTCLVYQFNADLVGKVKEMLAA